jgi:hypothetical protein
VILCSVGDVSARHSIEYILSPIPWYLLYIDRTPTQKTTSRSWSRKPTYSSSTSTTLHQTANSRYCMRLRKPPQCRPLSSNLRLPIPRYRVNPACIAVLYSAYDLVCLSNLPCRRLLYKRERQLCAAETKSFHIQTSIQPSHGIRPTQQPTSPKEPLSAPYGARRPCQGTVTIWCPHKNDPAATHIEEGNHASQPCPQWHWRVPL